MPDVLEPCTDPVIAYIVPEYEDRYLMILDPISRQCFRFKVGHGTLARLATECSAELLRDIQRESYADEALIVETAMLGNPHPDKQVHQELTNWIDRCKERPRQSDTPNSHQTEGLISPDVSQGDHGPRGSSPCNSDDQHIRRL